jgi:hypothetical protein
MTAYRGWLEVGAVFRNLGLVTLRPRLAPVFITTTNESNLMYKLA